MADVAKHPWLMKRGDTYYVRARVPQDLIDTLKRDEIKYSLRTKCPKAALAKVRTEAAKIEAEFEAHRIAQNTTTSNSETTGACATQRPGLRPQELQKICDDHYQRVIDDDFNWRADITEKAAADDEGFRHGQYIAHPTTEWYQMHCGDLDRNEKLLLCFEDQLEHRLNALETALATADCASHVGLSRDALGKYGVAHDPDDIRRLTRKLMEAELSALVAIRDRDQTRYDAIVARYATEPATKAAAPSAAPSSDPGPLLASLVKDFLAEERAAGLVPATLQKERAVLAEFVDVAGNKAIRCYTKSDATQFKNALLKSPANRNAKPFAGLGLTDAVKLAEDMRKSGSEVPSLNVDTINDKLLYARKLFAWADGRFGDVSNPFEGQRIKRRRQRGRRSDRRYPFTTRELQALFDGPVYRGCKSRHHWKQPGDLVLRDSARFWAPLIALHTGMRLGEIIQLRMADIRTDADGIAYFDVTTLMDDDDEEAAKSLKNVNSVRQIPIHPQLIAFGLQHLIDQRRKASEPRLLMDYGRSEVDGKWSKTFGAWFRRYRRHVGVERFVNGKNRVDFHSFRHVFEDVVRDLPDVKQEVRDALQGHGENGVSQGYGTGVYRKRLYEAIQKVCFPELDLTHLVIDGHTS